MKKYVCSFLILFASQYVDAQAIADSTYLFSLQNGEAFGGMEIANKLNKDGQLNYFINKMYIDRSHESTSETVDSVSYYGRNFKWEQLPFSQRSTYPAGNINDRDTILMSTYDQKYDIYQVKAGPRLMGSYPFMQEYIATKGSHFVYAYTDIVDQHHVVHDGIDQMLPITPSFFSMPRLSENGQDYALDVLETKASKNGLTTVYRPGKRLLNHVPESGFNFDKNDFFYTSKDLKKNTETFYVNDKPMVTMRTFLDFKYMNGNLAFIAINTENQMITQQKGKINVVKDGLYKIETDDKNEHPIFVFYPDSKPFTSDSTQVEYIETQVGGSIFRNKKDEKGAFYLIDNQQSVGPFSNQDRLNNLVWSPNRKHWAAIMLSKDSTQNIVVKDGEQLHSVPYTGGYNNQSTIQINDAGDVAYTIPSSYFGKNIYKNTTQMSDCNQCELIRLDESGNVYHRQQFSIFRNEAQIQKIQERPSTDFVANETQYIDKQTFITKETYKGNVTIYVNEQALMTNVQYFSLDTRQRYIYAFVKMSEKMFLIKKRF